MFLNPSNAQVLNQFLKLFCVPFSIVASRSEKRKKKRNTRMELLFLLKLKTMMRTLLVVFVNSKSSNPVVGLVELMESINVLNIALFIVIHLNEFYKITLKS